MSQLFCLFFIMEVLTCPIKWNKLYLDNAHMCLIAIAAIAYNKYLSIQ